MAKGSGPAAGPAGEPMAAYRALREEGAPASRSFLIGVSSSAALPLSGQVAEETRRFGAVPRR
ncbi:hypothetical protein [Nonomuraea recticatena]|uniref:Uncharacterized protein n=1 Tax=Nonomuraea recticatena TaxID=46178 RepID=A0ABP6F2S4_9ACTN